MQQPDEALKTCGDEAGHDLLPSSGSDNSASLSELFGYFEESDSNSLGLLRRVAGLEQTYPNRQNAPIPHELNNLVQIELDRMPRRPTINFLMQFFVTELNWMSLLVHPPSLMAQYESWWARRPPSAADTHLTAADIDFAVLLLRICSFASQFLPSASYTVDSVRGVPLVMIRDTCNNVAASLEGVAAGIDPRGSLVRVQHMCFAGLNLACEGRMRHSWTTLGATIRVAQRLGFHREVKGIDSVPADELDREMRRRVFCNLYLWDGLLSRQLDYVPFLNNGFNLESLPRMHLTPGIDRDSDAPEGFTERLLQARLVAFWKDTKVEQSAGIDFHPTIAQERYERFKSEFLCTLPPAFSLQPNLEWDEQLPKLPLQRQLLYIAIFESICQNFRPLLLLEPDRLRALPAYKQVLLSTQSKVLAIAALKVLDAVSALHAMLDSTYTRFPAVLFHTFEAAVLLLCLCIKDLLPGNHVEESAQLRALDIAHVSAGGVLVDNPAPDSGRTPDIDVSREQCILAAETALGRLQVLAEVSSMAEAGARCLSQLLQKAVGTSTTSIFRTAPPTPSSSRESAGQDPILSVASVSCPVSEFSGADFTTDCGTPEWLAFDSTTLSHFGEFFRGEEKERWDKAGL
ncbi:hypothetical protein DL768_002918 [Monosporascus sp. mg162]|nr:hypothetical protein DL768_002918 [Monosporascus sp. mg162]